MEQVPAATSVIVNPETVQTAVELEVNVALNPELAVALNAKGTVPRMRLLNGPNVIVWGVGVSTVWIKTDEVLAVSLVSPP